MISVDDPVLLKDDFYGVLSSTVIIDQSQSLILWVCGDPSEIYSCVEWLVIDAKYLKHKVRHVELQSQFGIE